MRCGDWSPSTGGMVAERAVNVTELNAAVHQAR